MDQVNAGELLEDRAQNALWTALRSGKLHAGQFLSISQLVDILDFPVAAIREAVKQASSRGLLVTLPKRGVQIMEARPETIYECIDFRMVFDQEGARRRIASKSFDGLSELRARHIEMKEAARNAAEANLPAKAISVDLSLHDFLADGLRNSQLEAAYDANRLRIAIIQNARPFLQDRIVSAMEEHLAIMDAVENCDAEAAIAAVGHHCRQTLRWWGVA